MIFMTNQHTQLRFFCQAENHLIAPTFITILIVLLFPYSSSANSAVVRLAEDGTAAYQAGDYATALQYWQAGLQEAQQAGNPRHAGVFLYSLGMAHERLHRYEDALNAYAQALQLREQLGDVPGQVTVLNNLGIVLDKLGRYAQALERYRQALPLARQSGDADTEGRTLLNIGIAHFHAGNYAAAFEHLQQARTIYQQLGRPGREADALNNIGNLYERQGRYQEALNIYRRALALQQSSPESGAQGRALNNIGAISWHLGQYDHALTYYNLALEAKRAAGDRRGAAATLHNIGVVHWKQADYARATDSYQQALRLRQALSDQRGMGSTLIGIGRVHADEGRSREALEAFQQALSIARSIGDRIHECLALAQLGKLYSAAGKPREAYEAFRQSVTLGTQLQARGILWEALRGLAAEEAERRQFQEAVQHYEQAVAQIEALRAEYRVSDEYAALMDDKFEVYDDFLALLSRLHQAFPDKGYAEKAFEIFERRQGRMFLEQMGKTGARRFAGVPEDVRRYEEALETRLEHTRHDLTAALSQATRDTARIAELEGRLSALHTERHTLRATLQARYPAYEALRYPQPVSLDELRRRVMQPDELMLVYHVMPGQTLLWIIGARQTQMRALPAGERDIQQLVMNLRFAMLPDNLWNSSVEQVYNPARFQDVTFEEAGYALFSAVLPQDARPLLAQGRPVYIVPSGALYAVPFEAFITRPVHSIDDAHFLLEDVTISYLSSASLLKTLRDARSRSVPVTRYPLLAFANPDYQAFSEQLSRTNRALQIEAVVSAFGGQVAPLEDTEQEARAITALFQAPPESRPLQLRQDASLANLLQMDASGTLNQYRYLLFSLHGIIPGEVTYVEQPALILSDDLLMMSDVFGLRLNADMVMLSACNTGRGQYRKGEGVMGLTRAFMYAGTPTTTVTLWSVFSVSAKELSIGMFKHLKQGDAPADALRATKLQMLRGQKGQLFKEAVHWAPFVIFGEGFFSY